jgi:hypothetical protein
MLAAAIALWMIAMRKQVGLCTFGVAFNQNIYEDICGQVW